MKLYNTMSRQVEDFEPIGHKVTVYTCGPTVYLDPHIGNWRTFINYDLLMRTLSDQGWEFDHVLNITDVGHLVGDGDEGEDKLAKTAKAQRKSAWDIAEHYTEVFFEGLDSLNINQPSHLPKATDHIQEQINMISELEKQGATYEIEDGIYFDTSKAQDYGKLARADLEGQLAGARVEENKSKRSPQDFALWKFSPKDQQRDMEWGSPWGTGFPGWHLECSAMALKYLGKTIDIHGGGIDHIPVHHANEIAQSETANQAPFARFWFHSAFMTVDGTKMSKSIGNVYTLKDLEDKGFDPLAYRLFVLQAHYRTESNFTWEGLEGASNRLSHLRAFSDLKWQGSSQGVRVDIDGDFNQIKDALANDLDTPGALEQLSILINKFDNVLPDEETAKNISTLLTKLDQLLGLDLSIGSDIDDASKKLLSSRQDARNQKDFEAADKLRDELKQNGITINDTSSGQIWSRVL